MFNLKLILVWFGLMAYQSTIVAYSMSNPLYTYILNKYMICKHICVDNICKRAEAHSFVHS